MTTRMIFAAIGSVAALTVVSSPLMAQQPTSGAAAASGKPRGIVVDFSASWCGPCQQMAPIVERLAREGYSIKSIDVDQRPDLKAKYNITSLPTFVLIVDGKEQKRRIGAMPESEVRRMLAAIPVTQPATPPAQILAGDPTPATSTPPTSRQPVTQPPPARTRSALLDMLPGRRSTPPAIGTGTVIRANAEDRVPALPISKGPMAASVRIRVKAADSVNFGSGTIIGSSPGRATVATCWHIFRDANRDTKIEVDAFFTGQTETYVAKFVAADEKADVGLIEILTDTEWPTARVAPTSHAPRANDAVVSIGCGGGADPTRQSIRVTELDRYNGPNNIECSGVPVRGRSGGGLFNTAGELVGICSAADKEDQRGIYAGLFALHDILDQANLAGLYRNDASEMLATATPDQNPPTGPRFERTNSSVENRSGGQPSIDEFLNGPTPPASREPAPPTWPASTDPGLGASVPASRTAVNPFAATAAANPPPAAPASPATAAAGGEDVEIVCIVRSKSNPNLGSRVIVIDQSDPRLLELLREYDRKSQQR